MRIGQTSLVVFLSKLTSSLLGFVATLYFARLLGPEVLGYYAVIMAVVSWLKLGGTNGVSDAISKRVSEGTDQTSYFTAGALIIILFSLVLSIGVYLFNDYINAYVGVNAWDFIIALLFSGVLASVILSTLQGERKVHISGLLGPTNLILSSITQILLVFAGLGLTGMLIGYLVGELSVVVIGSLFLSIRIKRPKKHHFTSLIDFAKYSWLGGLKARSFNDVDILILGALVPSSLVGIYSVAWSISKFLTLFGSSIRYVLFPEISNADANRDDDRIEQLTEESLAFVGLIAIPGLFGGLLLGDRLLRIYGSAFTRGTAVLGLLILATLIYGYQQQILVILRAIDRPDVAFRINLVFITTNIVLNVVLILLMGWIGAAIATVLSAVVGLVFGFCALRNMVNFNLPIDELSRQLVSAILMAGVVYVLRRGIEETEIIRHNALLVALLATVGAGIYFLVLLAISDRFRQTVVANSPISIPFLTS